MIEVTESTFQQEVVGSELPVLVEYWASWCPPCKMMEPVIERLAEQFKGSVKFVAINIDRNGSLADQAAVSGVPTFIMFHKGVPSEQRLIGAQTERKLRRLINSTTSDDGEQKTGVDSLPSRTQA